MLSVRGAPDVVAPSGASVEDELAPNNGAALEDEEPPSAAALDDEEPKSGAAVEDEAADEELPLLPPPVSEVMLMPIAASADPTSSLVLRVLV